MHSTDTEHLRETLVGIRPIYTGRIISVREDEIRYPSGRTGYRELIAHPGAVCIVARDDAGRYVLVRQWRHAIGGPLWELTAGTLEPDEDVEVCAKRELAEETGYSAARWTRLAAGACSPGSSTEIVHFFLAEGLSAGEAHPDQDELLDVALMDVAQLRDVVAAGHADLKTIAGLALAGVSLDG